MKSVTHSIFKTFLLSMLIIAQMHFAYAQTASILPPAKTTFLDANGKPLTAGTVESFIPSTSTHKTTWQDAAETIPNANPLILDAAGRALLLGSGSYRQVVKDRLNNVIWDQVTSSTGSGGGGGSTSTGDGDLVGTIKPWAGMTAPNQYVFTYGQELSRTTYSALFTAITSTQAIFCNSGSPILNGLADTTNFWIGMVVELSCVAPGFTTVISKTATTVTLALNSNVTTGTNAVFFPWGRGNGSTTFNMPDVRGFVLAGNDNMGGVAANTLTVPFYPTDPNSIGASGGSQSHAITTAEVASHNHPVFLLDPGHVHTQGNVSTAGAGGTYGAGGANTVTSVASNSAVTGITVRDAPTGGTTNQTGNSNGGIAVSAINASGGSGYTNGAQTITVAGGTCSVQPQFTVTVAGNVFTGTPALLTAGSCTITPPNPAATTGGGGTGGTLNVSYSSQPISLIQPTKTSNYIIKVLPDDNSATASGVTALGGMTGSIACGTGLLCTGNNISATTAVVTCASLFAGTPGVDCNNLNIQTSNYTIDVSDCGKTINAGNGANSLFNITLPAVAGFASTCTVSIINVDTNREKILLGFPSSVPSGILWPQQFLQVSIINGAWITKIAPKKWRPASAVIFNVSTTGTDNSGCLGTGASACATGQYAMNIVCQNLDPSALPSSSPQVTIKYADGAYTSSNIISSFCDPGPLPFVGSTQNGWLKIAGNTNLTGVTLACGANVCFSPVGSLARWWIEGFSTTGTGYTVVADAASWLYLGANKFGTTGGSAGDVNCAYGSTVEFEANFTTTGSKSQFVSCNQSGSKIIYKTITVTFSASTFTTFYTINTGALIAAGNAIYSGSATVGANGCIVANTGGGLDTGGNLAAVTTACGGAGNSLVNPGWAQ